MTPAETRETLWRHLTEAGCASGPAPHAQEADDVVPWHVRLMLGAAGWLAAGCLFVFFALAFKFPFSGGAQAGLGLLVCAVSVTLYRYGSRNAFFRQFAFALSLAGTGLLAWGAFGLRFGEDGVFFAIACLLALLFAAIPDFTHRVWASGAGSVALACGAIIHMYRGGFPDATLGFAGLLCLGMTGLWLAEFRYPGRNALLRSGAYGLTLAFLALAAGGNFMTGFEGRMRFAPNYAWIICGSLAFLWAALVLLQRENVDFRARSGAAPLSLALLLLLINLKLTCLAPCLTLLLLGRGQGKRALTGLGVIALLAYLNFYYYTLAATLLQKSLYMASAGAALLAARFVLLRLWPEDAAEKAGEAQDA